MYLTLVFFVALILPIPVMIQRMGKRVPPYRALLEGILAGVAGSVLIMIIASATGNRVFDTIQESIRYMAQTLAKDPMSTQLFGEKTTEADRVDLLTQIYGQAADLVPSTICIFTAITAYIEYIILSRILKPAGVPAIRMPGFRDFDLPRNVIIGWVVIFLLSWILAKTGFGAGDLLYANINALFNFVFCLQGMSVIFMFCYRKRAPKAIAVILILFFLFSAFGKMVLLILGFADVLFRIKEKLR